ncbi:RNA polymerase II mediator complex subunit, partial [Ascosphaera aggregata]
VLRGLEADYVVRDLENSVITSVKTGSPVYGHMATGQAFMPELTTCLIAPKPLMNEICAAAPVQTSGMVFTAADFAADLSITQARTSVNSWMPDPLSSQLRKPFSAQLRQNALVNSLYPGLTSSNPLQEISSTFINYQHVAFRFQRARGRARWSEGRARKVATSRSDYSMNIILPTDKSRFSQAQHGAPRNQQARRVTPAIYADPQLLASHDEEICFLLDYPQCHSFHAGPPAKRRRLLKDDCPSRPRSFPLDLLRKPKRHGESSISVESKATSFLHVKSATQKKLRDSSRDTAQSLPELPVNPFEKASSYRSRLSVLDPVGIRNLQVETSFSEVEPPEIAPALHTFIAADYHPWVGSHTEDISLSKSHAQGHQPKTETSYNELGSSRSAVYKQLNQSSNLEALSVFLTSVITSKHILSQVEYYSLPSQPRRVALTDTKREAWLRDLANPRIPLHELSHTIPNGIRAKILFEQCLSKLIPIERAVWFVQNMNGHENRMYQKSPLNEAFSNDVDYTSTREWASSAYQFLEDVLTSPVDAFWRRRTIYAIQLCANLLLHDLLDSGLIADIYLDSLEKSSVQTLPLRLVLLETLFPHITWSRNDAQKLASCLNDKYKILSEMPGIYQLFSGKIAQFFRRWVRCRASGSVLALDWLIQDITSRHHADGECSLDCVISHFLAQEAKGRGVQSQVKQFQSLSERLTQILDGTPLSTDAIISICRQYPDDLNEIAYLLLAWASSTLGSDVYRIYLVAIVLRIWGHANVNLHEVITSALMALSRHPYSERSRIYHVISELVRHYSFSMFRYMQWIMARQIRMDKSPNGMPLEVELLANLPSSALPRHIWNLRNNLLIRFGFSVTEEHQLIKRVRCTIQCRVPALFNLAAEESSDEIDDCIDFRSLSRTIKVNVAIWLRDAVCKTNTDLGPYKPTDRALQPSAFTVADFVEVRSIFEQLEEIEMLADILEHVACSRNSEMLAAVLQTLLFHLDSLTVLERAGHIFSKLNTAVLGFLETSTSLPGFIGLYLSVTTHFSIDQPVKAMIRKASSTGKGFVDLKSFRESLSQSLGTNELRYWSDIRNSSRQPADQRAIDRLLTPLCSLSPKAQSVNESDVAHIAATVYQLRLFDTNAFDHAFLEWLLNDLIAPKACRVVRILPFLVGVGAITLQSFCDLVRRVIAAERNRWSELDSAQFCQKFLLALLPEVHGMLHANIAFPYSFEKSRRSFFKRRAEDVLHLLQLAHKGLGERSDCEDGLSTDNVSTLICEVFIHCPASIPLSSNYFASGQSIIFHALGRLLECENSQGITAEEETISKLGPFSAKLCGERLRLLIAWEKDHLVRHQMEEVLLSAYIQQESIGATFHIDPFYCLPAGDLEVISRQLMAHAMFLSLNPNIVPESYTQSANYSAVSAEDSKAFFDFYLNPDANDFEDNDTKVERSKLQTGESAELMFRNTFALLDNTDSMGCIKAPATWTVITNEPFMLLCRLQVLLRLSTRCSLLIPVDHTHSDRAITSCIRLIFAAISSMLPSLSSDELKDALAGIANTAHDTPKTFSVSAFSLQAQASKAVSAMIGTLPNEALHYCAYLLGDPWTPHQWDSYLVYVILPLLRELSARLVPIGGSSIRFIAPPSPADSFIIFGLDPPLDAAVEEQRSGMYQEDVQLSAFSELACDPTVFEMQSSSSGA